jgi:hypothetical protein
MATWAKSSANQENLNELENRITPVNGAGKPVESSLKGDGTQSILNFIKRGAPPLPPRKP